MREKKTLPEKVEEGRKIYIPIPGTVNIVFWGHIESNKFPTFLREDFSKFLRKSNFRNTHPPMFGHLFIRQEPKKSLIFS